MSAREPSTPADGPETSVSRTESAHRHRASSDGPETSVSRTESAHRRDERRLAAYAERQHGLVTLAQLQGLGLSASGVRSRIEAGRLHPVRRGVYAAGYRPLTVEGRWMAAVLACGPEAVLSHGSAAALWGLREVAKGAIHVTAPGRRGRVPAGIAAHRDGSLRPVDRTVVRGIPCTSIARTLLDFAGVATVRHVCDAVAEAEVLRLVDLTSVDEVIRRNPGRRGVATLRLVISRVDPQVGRTRSRLEQRFLTLCERAGLPPPEVNASIELGQRRVEPDFLWRESRLIVETDGRKYHDTGSAFERDRRRDQQLTMAGWQVVRCTWRQVTREPTEVGRMIHAILAQQANRRS